MEGHGDEPYIEAERRRKQREKEEYDADHWEDYVEDEVDQNMRQAALIAGVINRLSRSAE